jgi:hypothetical protein
MFVVLCVGCAEKEVAVPDKTPLPSTQLCDTMIPRLRAADAEVKRLSGPPIQTKKGHPPVQIVSQKQLDKLQKATHDYLRIRTKAAAFGCLTT